MVKTKLDETALYASPIYKVISSTILLAIVSATFWQYVYGFYGNSEVLGALEKVVQGIGTKPYIYRYLVPLIVRFLMWMKPVRVDIYIVLVMYLAALGVLFSFQYLYRTFWQGSVFADLTVLMGMELMFLLIYKEKKIYDLSTIFLFTLLLALMARGKWMPCAILYPLACLSKETVIFLLPVFAVYFWRKLPRGPWALGVAYQLVCFALVRLCLMWVFRANPGDMFNSYFSWHLAAYGAQPWLFLLYGLGFGLVIFWVLKDWANKPFFLRLATGLIMPMVGLLYFVVGMPFEIRIFAEVYPLIYLLAMRGVMSQVHYTPDPFVPSNLVV
jgi:hypothetical protein